ncbi:MAG: ThiF family adenylyltransferase [Solirubrobacterales bacterium]
MSPGPISRSPDLKQLRDEGYDIAISPHAQLVIRDIPYVGAGREIRRGTMVSTLNLSAEVAARPDTHVVYFIGEHPCDKIGNPLGKVAIGSENLDIGEGPVAALTFSSKPPEGYADYYQKMTSYIRIVSAPAQALDSQVTAQTYPVIESDDPESVFEYLETASSRAGIESAAEKLKMDRIAIIGLGGTGSYLLDLVAKTPVREIHLYDGDSFLQHNAFRAPGAASLTDLSEAKNKAAYWRDRYTPMRRNIFAHEDRISEANVEELVNMEFVFICIDEGPVKKLIVEHLEACEVEFIDVGMGVFLTEGSLGGQLRTTTSTVGKRSHVHDKKRISFSEGAVDDLYQRNIQIADLNALNAALAVIKWKKLRGFYIDLEAEHFSIYQIDGNHLLNEDG